MDKVAIFGQFASIARLKTDLSKITSEMSRGQPEMSPMSQLRGRSSTSSASAKASLRMARQLGRTSHRNIMLHQALAQLRLVAGHYRFRARKPFPDPSDVGPVVGVSTTSVARCVSPLTDWIEPILIRTVGSMSG